MLLETPNDLHFIMVETFKEKDIIVGERLYDGSMCLVDSDGSTFVFTEDDQHRARYRRGDSFKHIDRFKFFLIKLIINL